jgi:hypothetical protein
MPPCFCRERWNILGDIVPKDVRGHTLICMPQQIAHAAYVGPRLSRQKLWRSIAQTMGCLANSLKAPFDGVTGRAVGLERIAVHAGHIASDPVVIFDHIGQTRQPDRA